MSWRQTLTKGIWFGLSPDTRRHEEGIASNRGLARPGENYLQRVLIAGQTGEVNIFRNAPSFISSRGYSLFTVSGILGSSREVDNSC